MAGKVDSKAVRVPAAIGDHFHGRTLLSGRTTGVRSSLGVGDQSILSGLCAPRNSTAIRN